MSTGESQVFQGLLRRELVDLYLFHLIHSVWKRPKRCQRTNFLKDGGMAHLVLIDGTQKGQASG